MPMPRGAEHRGDLVQRSSTNTNRAVMPARKGQAACRLVVVAQSPFASSKPMRGHREMVPLPAAGSGAGARNAIGV